MSDPPALRTVTARLFGGPYHGLTYDLPGDYPEHWTPDGNHLYTRHTLMAAVPHECVFGIQTMRVWRVYTYPDFPRDEVRARLIFPVLGDVEPGPGDWVAVHRQLWPIADEVTAGQWRLRPGVIQFDTIRDREWLYGVAREFEAMLEATQRDDSTE